MPDRRHPPYVAGGPTQTLGAAYMWWMPRKGPGTHGRRSRLLCPRVDSGWSAIPHRCPPTPCTPRTGSSGTAWVLSRETILGFAKEWKSPVRQRCQRRTAWSLVSFVTRSTSRISSALRKLDQESSTAVEAGERCRLDWTWLAGHCGHWSVSSNRQGDCFGVPSFQLTFLHSSPTLPTSLWGTGNGERGTGRVSKWRPHHCPRLATARSPPPRQWISGSTPSKRRCASQGRDCRCARVMGEKGGCRESRIRPGICRENHAPTPAKTPVFSQAWGLSPPKP